MRQWVYSEIELEEVIDLDEETTSFSTPRQRNPLFNDGAEIDSFRDFDSDYEDVTIFSSISNDLSLPRSPALFDAPQPKKRVVLVSSDIE